MKTAYVYKDDSKLAITNKRFLSFFYHSIAWIIAANFFIIMKAWGIDDSTGFLVFTQDKSIFMVHLEASAMGLCLGLFLTYLDRVRFHIFGRKKSFGFVLLIKSITYFASLIIIITLVAFVFLLVFGASFTEAVSRIGNFMLSTYYLTIFIYGAFVSFLISFIKQIDSKFGPGNLFNMLVGKYHQPRVEDRIFLFIDMKSSTTCAENLGHIQYSQLLQECFYNITSLIIKYKGEIYQYVGDEIVITWKSKAGLKDCNCLNLFFNFLERIEQNKDHYKRKYGLIPEFKAGMNCGHITVAEVGILKREIAYHGDIINTAARIQLQCNTYDEQMLISGQLYHRLVDCSKFNIKDLDRVNLKGKRKPVEIYSVNKIEL